MTPEQDARLREEVDCVCWHQKINHVQLSGPCMDKTCDCPAFAPAPPTSGDKGDNP